MKKRRLITSALPYVNNAPHLGNIVGCVLSADVFARFCRQRGYETLYVCGTDGYGTATETKARQENTTPAAICEKYHQIHESVYKAFDITFDAFGKTFCDTHTQVVQDLYHSVEQAGYFNEKEAPQTFCESCDKYLADRFVEGECPSCHYSDARGDQCESCGTLLNPEDLLKPRCSTCSSTPTQKNTKHLYLDLPKISPTLEQWQNSSMAAGKWTANAEMTSRSWIENGLKERPITRDLKWGVKVPREGYDSKVFYVWFDAPIGYISITKEAFPDDWEKWWKMPHDTELFQFMGKDNIPFHSVIFPAIQLASDENWTTVHHLNSTEYLNYEADKFSKSKGIGIFGTDVAKLPYPIDFWRFYLMRVRPEKQDSTFSWQDFADRVNNELVDNIGNLVNRTLIYFTKNFPKPIEKWEWNQEEQAYIEVAQSFFHSATDLLERNEQKEALGTALQLGKHGNKFFQNSEPWKLIKEDKERVERIITLLVYTIRDLSILLSPFVPGASKKISGYLGNKSVPSWDEGANFSNMAGTSPSKPEILFTKISAEEVDEYRDQFSGNPKTKFEDLEIRVGQVKEAKVHPNAESLLIEKVDLGDKIVNVVSGIAKFYKPEDLVGQKIILVTNVEPANLRGEVSEAIVLTVATRKKMELLTTEASVGSTITIGSQSKISDPKGLIDFKSFEEVKLEVQNHKAMHRDLTLQADGHEIISKVIAKGKVK